ncbi:MAG TPA: hypothetical protein VH575_28210 [Gemmataceae bacterium]|jgi:hypothetical protein
MKNNSDASYQFVLTAMQRQQLKTWAERAAALGRTAEYLAALKIIHRHLTTDPLAWGEPWYRLSKLGLQVYHRGYPPLHVSYAVDTAHRIVYAKQFRLFSGSGLE